MSASASQPSDDQPPDPARPPELAGRCLEGGPAGSDPSGRYVVHGLLGSGASSHVWSASDRNLQREVVVKVLRRSIAQSPEDVGEFIAEARLTAAMRHPGILPVHDLEVTTDGRPYFIMPRLEGWTLAEVIHASTPEQRDPRLPDINAVVQVFISAAHAIGYAHHQGVVHQDIKPDNLLLGAFGEVQVLDWGAALSEASPDAGQRIQGTPLYMSPEQARRESVDARSDQFAFGATLFHALALRPPTLPGGMEASLARRRAGELDPPTDAERARIPAPLLAIAARALAADPAARYQSLGDLRADLEAWQAGQAISVFTDPLPVRLGRWHRRSGRRWWIGLAAVTLLLGLAAALWGERLKDRAVWGAPVVVERFDDERWQQRWILVGGGFAARDGGLVSTGSTGSFALHRHRLDGPVAIEFIGEFPAGAQPGDLSVWWRREIPQDVAEGSLLDAGGDAYRFQVGAYDNAFCSIVGPRGTNLVATPFRLEAGRRYRIRAEVDGLRLKLDVDGERVCEWISPLPLHGGHFGIYAWYPGKTFSEVRIFAQATAERLSATAVGDAFAQEGLWRNAEREYARVATSHPGTELGRDALFRQGLARMHSGNQLGADAVWQRLAGTPWADRAAVEQLDAGFRAGARSALLPAMEALLVRAAPAVRRELAMRWVSWMAHLDRLPERFEQVPAFVAVRDRHMAGEAFTEKVAAESLSRIYLIDDIERRYPRQRTTIAWTLLGAGRPAEVIERYADQFTVVQHAYRQLALYGRMATDPGIDVVALSLLERGQAEAVATNPAVGAAMRARALHILGRIAEAERMDPATPTVAWIRWSRGDESAWEPYRQHLATMGAGQIDEQAIAAFTLGRLDEAERAFRAQGVPWCLQWLAQRRRLEAWIAGDRTSPFPAVSAGHLEYDRFDAAFAVRLLPALLAGLSGQRAAVDVAAAAIVREHAGMAGQRLLHLARFITGAEDEAAFLSQPYRLDLDRLLLAARAMRAELTGDGAAARNHWSAFRSLPSWRLGIDPTPCLDRLADWRLHGR